MVKYIIIALISWGLIRMIRWANHGIHHLMAGIVSGIVCMVCTGFVNYVRHRAWTYWLMSIFEALLVAVVTILILDLSYRLRYGAKYRTELTPVSKAKAFSTAITEISQTFSEVTAAHAAEDFKNVEFRLIMANQLEAMIRIVKEWSIVPVGVDHRYRMQLEKIVQEARKYKLQVEDIHCYLENDHLILQAFVSSKYQQVVSVKEYMECINRSMPVRMLLEKQSPNVIGVQPVQICAYEEADYYLLFGMAAQNRKGSAVSGDSFSIIEREDQKTHLCISDGMGSGRKAASESQLVIRLMDKLIEAGFDRTAALELLNSTMVVCTQEDAYATLDYATIDLYMGTLELTKIGAAASFLKRGERVEIIRSKNPPAGVKVQMDMPVIEKGLESGDFLVMVTDGVIEYLKDDEPEEYFAELIRNVHTVNASVFAKRLMEQVLQRVDQVARDDMTILVTAIWRK